MGQLAVELSDRGYRAQKWESIGGAGTGLIFRRVCKAIHVNDIFIADITETNLNVLFEVGYAIGVGRDPFLLKDRNRTTADGPTVLPTQYQCFYERIEHIWPELQKYSQERESESYSPNRISSALRGVDLANEREGYVYLLPAWHDQAWGEVNKTLEHIKRQGGIRDYITADPTESLFDSFLTQARLIAEAEFIIGLMVSQNFRESLKRNAPVAMLLGLAAGLGKELVLLHEEPSRPVLDLGTVLSRFTGHRQAGSIVNTWIQRKTRSDDDDTESEPEGNLQIASPAERGGAVTAPSQGSARSRRRARRTRVRFFGPPDATLDSNLMEYFVETPAFQSALEGEKEILIGRKGVGKSSILAALEDELANRQDRIFVSITPIDLEYEQLAVALDQIGPAVIHPNFLYPSFWRFIILTEIVRSLREHPMWPDLEGLSSRDATVIRQVSEELEEPITADFSSRVMYTLHRIGESARTTSPDQVRFEVEKIVSRARLYDLEDALVRLSNRLPIFVAIDDIDKRWNPKFDPSVIWLKGLFDEMARLRRKLRAGLCSVILLREDMFSHIKERDADFANRSTTFLRWNHEQLEEVIRARLDFLVDQEFDSPEEAWNALFPAQTSGIKTSRYMIDRTLMRPRDLIQYCQLALERAQRGSRDRVEEVDILDSEPEFSRYLFDSIRTEALLTHPGLELAILPFLGIQSDSSTFDVELEIGLESLRNAGIQWASSKKDVATALFELGFFGLKASTSSTRYYSWDRSYEEAILLTRPHQELCVHLGFHSYLEIGESRSNNSDHLAK